MLRIALFVLFHHLMRFVAAFNQQRINRKVVRMNVDDITLRLNGSARRVTLALAYRRLTVKVSADDR